MTSIWETAASLNYENIYKHYAKIHLKCYKEYISLKVGIKFPA